MLKAKRLIVKNTIACQNNEILIEIKDQTLILNESLEPYGKSMKEVIKDKDTQIEELRELIRLKG